MTPAPRILVVSGQHWPRALVRAELRDAGYDAIGASTLSRALRYAPDDPDRGPVELLVVDSAALAAEPAAVELARQRYPGARLVLLRGAGTAPPGPPGRWAATLRRPISIGEIVAAVRQLVPLPQDRRHAGPSGDVHGRGSR